MLSPGLITKPFEQKPHGLPGKLILSLTSYERRFPTLARALAYLLNQTVRPDETRLYIAQKDMSRLPREVRALEKLGLTIYEVKKDIRSYKKLLPALKSDPDAFIAVADDDLYCDRYWLEALVKASKEMKGIVCHRTHGVVLDEFGRNLPYIDWAYEVPGPLTSPLLFPSTGAGALFPPGSFTREVFNEKVIKACAETTDDIWWWYQAGLAGTPFSKISENREVISLNGSQGDALWLLNGGGTNDRSLHDLYYHYGSLPKSVLEAKPILTSLGEVLTPQERAAVKTIRQITPREATRLAGPG